MKRPLAISCALFAAFACAPQASPQSQAAASGEARKQTAEELHARARSFAKTGDYTRAEQYLNLAADVGLPREQVISELIDVCVRDRRYRAAIQYAEQHLREHPRNYSLRFVLASLLIATGEPTRAREELEGVLRTQTEYAEAHYALAVVLRDELGNRSQADRHFREYLRLSPAGKHSEQAEESLMQVVP